MRPVADLERRSDCDPSRDWPSARRAIGSRSWLKRREPGAGIELCRRYMACSASIARRCIMGLRDKYAYAIQTAKGKFDGSAQEKDGKLYFAGIGEDRRRRRTKSGTRSRRFPTGATTSSPTSRSSAPAGRRRRRQPQNLHGEGWRYAERDRQGAARRRERLHEDLRREQGSADRSGQDQAGSGAEASLIGRRGDRSVERSGGVPSRSTC